MAVKSVLLVLMFVWPFTVDCLGATPHEGPDPIAHWIFNPRTVGESKVEARLGPNGAIEGEYQLAGQDQAADEQRHPGLRVRPTALVGEHPAIVDILATRLRQALDGERFLLEMPAQPPNA